MGHLIRVRIISVPLVK